MTITMHFIFTFLNLKKIVSYTIYLRSILFKSERLRIESYHGRIDHVNYKRIKTYTIDVIIMKKVR